MLCEKCKKKNATFHYRYSENGKSVEAHLCADCAKKSGDFDDINFDSVGMFSENGIFGELLGEVGGFPILSEKYFGAPVIKTRVCPSCGLSEGELRRSGKLGCKVCYSTFGKTVESMLERLHISSEYKGKVPENLRDSISLTKKIEKLKIELQRAVDAQEYEEAAKIRDSIKQLESFDGN